ncbi:MAG: tetratricopeptide repeat protein [Acidobacteriota bacterium]
MRRSVAAVLVLSAGVATGAGVYTVYASDQEYRRLIAVGDDAVIGRQWPVALESYSGAIALRRDSMVAFLKRGMTYREQGELTSALADLRRASVLDPTATLPLELLGDTLLALDRFERAADRYEQYVVLDDRSARVWYKLGLARYRAGQRTRVLPPLERALALEHTMAEAQLLRGLCLRDDGQPDEAKKALLIAAQLAPGLTAPREALAGLHAAAGEHAKAIDQLEALAALDPSRPERFVALGLGYARARRHEAAVLTLSRAVERFPNDSKVYAALGRVWLDAAQSRGDRVALKKAVEALSTAAGHSDAPSATLSALGRARWLVGEPAAAEQALRKAVTRLPVDPDAYLQLSTVIGRTGRIHEARQALINYVTLVGDGPSVPTIASQIASYSLRLGEPLVAKRWIEVAARDSVVTAATAALARQIDAALSPP